MKLSRGWSEEVGKFVEDVKGIKLEPEKNALGVVADALAEEIIDLHLYLENAPKKEITSSLLLRLDHDDHLSLKELLELLSIAGLPLVKPVMNGDSDTGVDIECHLGRLLDAIHGVSLAQRQESDMAIDVLHFRNALRIPSMINPYALDRQNISNPRLFLWVKLSLDDIVSRNCLDINAAHVGFHPGGRNDDLVSKLPL